MSCIYIYISMSKQMLKTTPSPVIEPLHPGTLDAVVGVKMDTRPETCGEKMNKQFGLHYLFLLVFKSTYHLIPIVVG